MGEKLGYDLLGRGVLIGLGAAGFNPLQFVHQSGARDVRFDVFNFLLVEFDFEGASAGDDDHALGVLCGLVEKQPACDVDGDIADTDDRDALVGREIARNVGFELVVVVDKVLGGVNAFGILAGETRFLAPCAPEAKTMAAGRKASRSASERS